MRDCIASEIPGSVGAGDFLYPEASGAAGQVSSRGPTPEARVNVKAMRDGLILRRPERCEFDMDRTARGALMLPKLSSAIPQEVWSDIGRVHFLPPVFSRYGRFVSAHDYRVVMIGEIINKK